MTHFVLARSAWIEIGPVRWHRGDRCERARRREIDLLVVARSVDDASAIRKRRLLAIDWSERVATHTIDVTRVVVDASRDVELDLRREVDLILAVDRVNVVVHERRALNRLDVERRLRLFHRRDI